MSTSVRPMTRRISLPVPTPTYVTNALMLPVGMSRDGRTVYGRQVADNTLMTSTNDGGTWTAAHTFPATEIIVGVYEMGNGEVIVAMDTTAQTNGKLYVSTGWAASPATATWSNTLSTTYNSTAGHVYFAMRYGSVNVDPLGSGIVTASEYGKQTAGLPDPEQAAVHSWLSADYGVTWTPLVDLLTIATGASLHIHGVAYDPWWDRIWLTHGDAGGTSYMEIFYSDDWRNLLTGGTATWQRVSRSAIVASATTGGYQAVQIMPLPTCIVFTSDDQPNAAGYRIGRRGYRQLGRLAMINTANRSNSPSIIGLHGRASGQGGAIFSITQQTAVGAGNGLARLFYTPDGNRFWPIAWDPAIVGANTGFYPVVGPTVNGKILGAQGTSSFVLDPVSPVDLPPRVGGVASITDGGTIAHGLGFAPTAYSITPTVAGRRVAITAADATNLTVSLLDAAGSAVAVAENVSWSAGV